MDKVLFANGSASGQRVIMRLCDHRGNRSDGLPAIATEANQDDVDFCWKRHDARAISLYKCSNSLAHYQGDAISSWSQSQQARYLVKQLLARLFQLLRVKEAPARGGFQLFMCWSVVNTDFEIQTWGGRCC